MSTTHQNCQRLTFSRWTLSNSRIIRFQKQSHVWQPQGFLPEVPTFQERLGGHLALVSDANIAGKTIATYNIHLESRADDQLRFAQLEEVLEDSKRHNSNTALCLRAISIWMYPRALQPVQLPALSFRTHSRTITSQRHLGHFWSTDGSLIGFLRVVVFAASNLLFTVRFRLPTIIRYPSMWLLSSAIRVPPSAGRASTSRRTSFGLLDLVPRSQPRRYRQISVMDASYRIHDLISERPEFLLSVENRTHS